MDSIKAKLLWLKLRLLDRLYRPAAQAQLDRYFAREHARPGLFARGQPAAVRPPKRSRGAEAQRATVSRAGLAHTGSSSGQVETAERRQAIPKFSSLHDSMNRLVDLQQSVQLAFVKVIKDGRALVKIRPQLSALSEWQTSL